MRSVVVKARMAVIATAAVAAVGLGAAAAQAGSTETAAVPAANVVSAASAASAAHAAQARPPVVRRCGTGQLGLNFRAFSAGAGQRFLTLVLINQSRSTCSVRGYPGLQFHGAFGRALATHVSRVRGAQPTVVLRPGGRAHSCLVWGAISPPFIHPNVIAATPPANHSALIVVWRWGQVDGGTVGATALKAGNSCV